MSGSNLDIENLFRSHMEDFSVDPSPGLWNQVQSKLMWKQFFAPRFNTFNVYYLGAILALTGCGLFLLLSPGDQDSIPGIPSQNEAMLQEAVSDDIGQKDIVQDIEMDAGPMDTESSRAEQVKENQSREEKVTTKKTTETPAEKRDPDQELGQISGRETVQPLPLKNDATSGDAQQILRADFTTSNLEGCAPLKVQFHNTSVNATFYSWTFGDGGISAEKDPSYLFDEPGTFQVVLKVRNNYGLEASWEQMLTVHETPKARFEIDETQGLIPQQPVYFYNYSKGADYYEWDFGDRTTSALMEPSHYYEQAGSYDIKLKVWTTEACYDSMILRNVFSEQVNQILFPNAFSPNPTGPTGGYYLSNDINNRVFHPKVKGDLLEYQLKVYSRKGVLVFESNDLSIGWDGYYQEKLAAQGVYIYKARGKFGNGQPFVKNGDLTLIYSR